VLINPVITARQGKETEEEACLSLPGIIVQITRAKKIKVSALDLDLKEQTMEATDLYARVLQHEIDHLDGILIIDRMTPAERLRNRKEIQELESGRRPRRRLHKAGAL
jgi:peptide deformylase